MGASPGIQKPRQCRWRAGNQNGERGANLVEFAVLAPLLIALLLGMLEFGWAFAQQIDVRHKARETLRLAIVDAPVAEIQARACADDVVVSADINQVLITTATTVGDPISVRVEADLKQITGLFGAFWGSDPVISSRVEGRIERESTTFSNNEDLAPCP